jgi:hypothetical protein
MSGQYVPPERQWAHDDWPARGRHAAGPPGPSRPVSRAPGAAPAGEAIWPGPGRDAAPAGVRGGRAPAGAGAGVPPSPPGPQPDPAAVTGPPWPRLVAAGGGYTPPRLIRWPIVVGTVLLAGWIAAAVALRTAPASPPTSAVASPPSSAAGSSPRPAAGSASAPAAAYVLTARGAHFTATFPGKPHRIEKRVGAITVIVYTAAFSDHAVVVTYARLPPLSSYSLKGGINGIAASLRGGKVVSRRSLTYLGKPAEDAVISTSGGIGRVRVVSFGSSAYVLEGFGNTAASFTHDYKVLLHTFTPNHP